MRPDSCILLDRTKMSQNTSNSSGKYRQGSTEAHWCHGLEWSENILCGGRQIIYVAAATYLSGGRHLNYVAAAR